MSHLYRATWPVEAGLTLDDVVPQAKAELPAMLDHDRAELHGKPAWWLDGGVLIMAAPAGPYRGERPWESHRAWMDDLMPDGWTDVDRAVDNSGEVV